MVIVHGYATIREGYLSEAQALVREHVLRSRAEPGCIQHAMHVDGEDPQRLVFIEKWADMDVLLAHFKVPASIAFANAIRALSTTPPVIEIHDAKEVKP